VSFIVGFQVRMSDKALEFYQVLVRLLATVGSPLWAARIHERLYIPVLVAEGLGLVLVFVILGRQRWFRTRWWSYPLLVVCGLGVVGSLNALGNAISYHPD
jgi:hypothetical protein